MYRQVVSLMLVMALLFQGICHAHLHAGECDHQPFGQDQAPHFHLCAIFGHHDDCPAEVDQQDIEPADENPAITVFRPGCHENDAIYVSALVMLRSQRHDSATGSSGCVPADMLGTVDRMLVRADSTSTQTHPPPLLLCCNCPIYLRTLALLI